MIEMERLQYIALDRLGSRVLRFFYKIKHKKQPLSNYKEFIKMAQDNSADMYDVCSQLEEIGFLAETEYCYECYCNIRYPEDDVKLERKAILLKGYAITEDGERYLQRKYKRLQEPKFGYRYSKSVSDDELKHILETEVWLGEVLFGEKVYYRYGPTGFRRCIERQ